MKTKLLIAAAALTFAFGAGAVSAKAPMNYDCSKAGNANKAACKAQAASTAAKPAATATKMDSKMSKSATSKSAMAKSSASTHSAMASSSAMAKKPMNYDCSKAGNANKTACKGQTMASSSSKAMASSSSKAMAPMSPAKPASNGNIVEMKTKNGKIYHYDCSKAGNKDLKVCKGH
jgi:hypothetical protein